MNAHDRMNYLLRSHEIETGRFSVDNPDGISVRHFAEKALADELADLLTTRHGKRFAVVERKPSDGEILQWRVIEATRRYNFALSCFEDPEGGGTMETVHDAHAAMEAAIDDYSEWAATSANEVRWVP